MQEREREREGKRRKRGGRWPTRAERGDKKRKDIMCVLLRPAQVPEVRCPAGQKPEDKNKTRAGPQKRRRRRTGRKRKSEKNPEPENGEKELPEFNTKIHTKSYTQNQQKNPSPQDPEFVAQNKKNKNRAPLRQLGRTFFSPFTGSRKWAFQGPKLLPKKNSGQPIQKTQKHKT